MKIIYDKNYSYLYNKSLDESFIDSLTIKVEKTINKESKKKTTKISKQ